MNKQNFNREQIMTEQEVEVSNEQIELHNKFCFMKKKILKYKKIVPLSHFIVYAMVSACLLALPSFLTVTTETTFSSSNATVHNTKSNEYVLPF